MRKKLIAFIIGAALSIPFIAQGAAFKTNQVIDPVGYGIVFSNGVGTSTLYTVATSSLNLLTTNVAEGTNLYWTNSRFDTRLATKSTTDLVEGNNLYYTDARVNAYISASSTIPKTYSSNVWTGLNTFNGGLTVGSLNGPLQANNGVVSATTSIGVFYGGTGITSPPSYGQLLMGNSSSGYDLVSTTTNALGLVASPLTSVQFHDTGGIFGGDSNFIWDKTNDRIGIQVSSPQVPLHVASITGTTLNNVTSGSASLVTETLPSAPTGSITKIAEPSAPGAGSGVSFVDQGAGSYQANGSVYTYRIYPMLDVGGGTYYRSQFYVDVSNTDPNDSDYYNISVDWDDAVISGEAVAYHVEKDVNSGGFSDFGVFTSSGFTDSGSGPGGSYTAFPTYYTNIPGTGPNAFTGGSAGATNVGMGGSFTEVPTTVLMEIDSVANIGGTNYVSGSPTSGSFDDTGLGTYDIDVQWTDNGNASNAIVRVSQDGGSSWQYHYTGSNTSPYTFTNSGNDSDAEARWGQTYSAGSVQYDFSPYGIGVAPSGNTVYSTTGATYSTSVPADSVNYIFKHSMTGGSSAPWKVVAPQASPSYGIQFSGDYYDVGYTAWGYGATVTPQSYGFSGTNQNRDYKIYSTGSGIFSITPLTVSTVSSGGTKSVSLSWSLPSGITSVKILRQINGGGYTVSKTVTGTSATDDSTDGTWTGNTTVTPTSIVGGAARFDKALTTLTDEPHLAIVETSGSGTRYPKLSFGVAANSSSAPSYLAHIYSTSNTGYLNFTTGRINIENSLGGTATTILGGAGNFFNNANSSSVHFVVKGLNDSSLINTRSDQDTVGFGAAIGSDQQTTVQIQPARSGDLGLVLMGHSGMSATSQLLRTQDSAGSFGGAITVSGLFQAGAGSVSAPGLSFRADSNTGFYNVSGDKIGLALGGVEKTRWSANGAYFGSSAGVDATARVHIQAGTTAASTAPIKLTSGSLNTTPEVGAIEFLTDNMYWTKSGPTRVLFVGALALPTNGRVMYAGSGGFMQDTANFTYSVNRLSPTYLTLGAGTATAGTAPLVMTSGTLLTTPIAGAVELLTDKWYGTITTGAARKEFTLNDAALTSGSFPVATTNGRLTDSTFTSTNLIAGTYTPTLTNTTNLDASTARLATYMRVGNTVTVSGQLDLDPTAPASATLLGISLPIASNFSTAYQLGGTSFATSIAGMGAGIESDATNDRASLKFISSDITNQTMTFTFTYQVI